MPKQIQVRLDQLDNEESVVTIEAPAHREIFVSLKYNAANVANGLIINFGGYLPESQSEVNRQIPVKVFERLHCSECIDRITCNYLPDVLYKCCNSAPYSSDDGWEEDIIEDDVSTELVDR